VGELALDNTDCGHQRAILRPRAKIKRLTLEQGKKENLSNVTEPQAGVRTLSNKNDLSV
jgi:hypothetical protein